MICAVQCFINFNMCEFNILFENQIKTNSFMYSEHINKPRQNVPYHDKCSISALCTRKQGIQHQQNQIFFTESKVIFSALHNHQLNTMNAEMHYYMYYITHAHKQRRKCTMSQQSQQIPNVAKLSEQFQCYQLKNSDTLSESLSSDTIEMAECNC